MTLPKHPTFNTEEHRGRLAADIAHCPNHARKTEPCDDYSMFWHPGGWLHCGSCHTRWRVSFAFRPLDDLDISKKKAPSIAPEARTKERG